MINKSSVIPRIQSDGDPTPAYFKLQMMLQEQIENGRWAPGQAIPPERDLAESHQLSVGTVKKAILNLVNEGYLYRIQGKGTFVAGMPLQPESLRYYRFLEDFADEEVELQIKLLGLKVIKGRNPANRYLNMRMNQSLFEVTRLFYFDKQPLVYCVSYLPHKMFEDLANLPRQKFENIPLYLALEDIYGLPTISNRELVSAIPANGTTAKKLRIKKDSPVLLIEMLSYTYKQTPYEYRRSYCLTDKRAIYREI
ncbi:MAG: GntR family transcriptional regulator [Deltaproteobacteria bacterium]|nr:GntR family transcriptional regulator [Deltaproteobacteria bacterium]